jgi:hypothetical protein
MYAVATFLFVALVSLLFTRMAAGVLIATGLPPKTAAFQARSAFTGAGFTTTESENVVNHPLRRRVISTTMFVGNLGVPTLVVTVVIGLVGPSQTQLTSRFVALTVGMAVLVVLAFSKPVTRLFIGLGKKAAQPALSRALRGGDAEILLTLSDEVAIVAVTLSDAVPLRSLSGLQRAIPEVKVLGMRPKDRPTSFVPRPPAAGAPRPGDRVVVLGKRSTLSDWAPELADGDT